MRWRRYEEEGAEWGLDRENYLSAKTHAAEVQSQFQEEEKLGAMVEMDVSEAKARYGNRLAIASLGAIEKKNGTYRVVHDGTHGIGINPRIKVRDQLKSPGAGDVRAVLQEMPGCFFALTGDVARAHRLVKVAEQDWGLLACRTAEGDKLWLNKVGSFGISSAAYHWSRLMSGLGRAVYYTLGKSELYLLVYVDDLLWMVCEAKGLELIVMSIFLLEVLGLPFAWKKFKGGIDVEWVGFELCLKGARLGLSEVRAQWLIEWLATTAQRGTVKIAELASVLGRLSFGLTALGHLRPFLGPIYAWVAAMGSLGECKVPKALVLIFRFLAAALEGSGRLAKAGSKCGHVQELFRTDAKAEGNQIWLGGWALDHSDPKYCRWFSEQLNHNNAPWLFAAGECYRQIASLELLATLAAVVTFGIPECARGGISCSAGTDNLGNSMVVARLLTTKFPLACFLMELALQLQRREADLELFWLPHLQNEEADALTNQCYTAFDPAKRCRFDVAKFEGIVLSQVLAAGQDLYEEIGQTRAGRELLVQQRRTKVRRTNGLKDSHPWG